MKGRLHSTRDDHVLRYTRGLSVFIAPFLLVAFVILYVFPTRTEQLWSWTIASPLTSMVLASAYAGGFYFFIRMLAERRWAAARMGFAAVGLFATLLGIATLIHWDKFNHHHIAFWIWAGLYFIAPFLVAGAWIANQRTSAPPEPDEQRLNTATVWTVAILGAAALVTGLAMVVAPDRMITLWAWPLTPLTCRVIGAVFCLGSALLGTIADSRWVTIRLMLDVEIIMVTLILVAAARGHSELYADRPLTWLLTGGLIAVLVGSVLLRHQQRSMHRDHGAVSEGRPRIL